MSIHKQEIKIFVASPGDVNAERKAICDVIQNWNSANSDSYRIILTPLLWEKDSIPFMANESSPQDLINEQLCKKSDIVIAVFGIRSGTPTSSFESGTIEEIENAIEAKKPVMMYFSNADLPRNFNKSQFEALEKIKDKYIRRGLICEYSAVEDLQLFLAKHLSNLINKHFSQLPQPTLANSSPSHAIQLENRKSCVVVMGKLTIAVVVICLICVIPIVYYCTGLVIEYCHEKIGILFGTDNIDDPENDSESVWSDPAKS